RISYGIVVPHEGANERSGFQPKRPSPNEIPVRRYATAPRFELGNEGVIFRADKICQAALGKPLCLAQLPEPPARLPSQLPHAAGGYFLRVRIHPPNPAGVYSKIFTPPPSELWQAAKPCFQKKLNAATAWVCRPLN